MIVELTVENLAIIERAQISLGPGLTVLTGETGAGKSLVVDAVELALGVRADTDLVRTGSSRAVVELVADLSDSPNLIAKCAELGLAVEDGRLFIQREVLAEGRSQCRVCGRSVPLSALKQIGQALVDLHGQHEHQSLLDASRHLAYLDAWTGESATTAALAVAEAFERWDRARIRLEAFRSGLRDLEQRLDLLRFQAGEIEHIAPRAGEMEELEAQLARLRNAERLSVAAFGAIGAISDDEESATEKLGAALKSLMQVSGIDPSLQPIADQLDTAIVLMNDAQRDLRAYAESLDAEPQALETAAERIDSLKRLRRKYGDDERAVLDYLAKVRAELDLLVDGEQSEEELALAAESARSELDESAAALTAIRKAAAERFHGLVEAELHELALERSVFISNFEAKEVDASGADTVEFYFSANPGEPPKPLARIASGGEISRTMLAIKNVLAGRVGVPTLIFDEVDAGLGGREAAVVANKLVRLAEHCQVVVISHLPQIAAKGGEHFRIEKHLRDGRSVTEVVRLDLEARVSEIARMLAGETITPTAMANAREMLDRDPAAQASML